MTLPQTTIWAIIILLALGTFALRFSFLGVIGKRPMPEWLLRLLRYTPVAVIPGLMAPRIFLPAEGAQGPDLGLIAAVAVTLAVGLWTRSPLWAMLGGALTLAALTLLGA
ncbi:MAG: AzlD domain-containing protein [Pararhodobacter sp.]